MDLEMREIYNLMRRRPDGPSKGPLHDQVWQATALMLASRLVSSAEYDAIFARLMAACKTFSIGYSSRNYLDYLRTVF